MNKRVLGFGLAMALCGLVVMARAQETASADPVRTGFFLQIQGGGAFFLKSPLSASKDFSLFGETGTSTETYKYGTAPAIDAAIGSYFRWGGLTIKAGLGFQRSFRRDSGSYTLTLPHPLEAGNPRTVAFSSDDLPDTSTSFYVFGLFSLIHSKGVDLWLGPIIGLGLEKFATLDDFTIQEKPPYSSADVSITDVTMIKTSVSSLWYGVAADAEFALSRPFALVASAKIIYDDPKIAALGRRANLLRIEGAAGFRIVF
ncbi:MAG: hypothetical protein NTZ26_11455 [Candidatus Aminicenantes bacterium]|nr:hypothetical protein [Candidatus Aminicenantes bacterium]